MRVQSKTKDPKDDFDQWVSPGQSIELLQHLHLLTREGKLNQDSRRKLKQIYHLYQFIEPLLNTLSHPWTLVDHGAGKSYLGFILYDLFLRPKLKAQPQAELGKIIAVESRAELVEQTRRLASQLKFEQMEFICSSIEESANLISAPQIEVVTALHACDQATDQAIQFALNKNARHLVLIPCCQAQVASLLRRGKTAPGSPAEILLREVWKYPLHTREFGSHLTNILRCLWLESEGYQVTVTEFTGWEHSMKNELILATKVQGRSQKIKEKLMQLLDLFQLQELAPQFGISHE